MALEPPNALFRQEALGLTDSEIATCVRRVADQLACPEDRVVILGLGEDKYDALRRGLPLTAALVEHAGLAALNLGGQIPPPEHHPV